jgi:hypothetical protein
MAREERREGPRERREHEPERSDRRGRDREVILAIVARKWLGSAPATAEAYARALAQWRQLPGAITTAATDLGNPAEAPVSSGAGDEDTQP